MSIKIISFASLLILFLVACGGGEMEIYDCPELELNFGDECTLDSTPIDTLEMDTVFGIVTEECLCEPIVSYDCLELSANIGDNCEDASGNEGTLNFDCQCDLLALGLVVDISNSIFLSLGVENAWLDFEIIPLSVGQAVRVKPNPSVQILDSSTFGYADALDMGEEISSGDIWSTDNNFVLGTDVGNAGQFEGAGVKHLGFRVEREGAFHYGWVALDNKQGNTSLEILSSRLNFIAGEPILAGN